MTTKTFLILGLVGAALLISSTRSSAQEVIYYDSLENAGGSPLNGTTPTTDTTGDTWVADAGINETATGATLGTGDSAYLPFTPVLGDDYTLTVNVVNSTGTSYVGGGFSSTDPTSNQFYGDGQEAYMVLSGPAPGPNPPAGTTTVSYLNPGNNIQASGTYTDSEILTTEIDTTTNSSNWTEKYYVDGTLIATLQDAPENEMYVGFGDLNNSGTNSGLVSSFELVNLSAAAVPEPSSWAMMVLGGLGMLILVRRRKHLQA